MNLWSYVYTIRKGDSERYKDLLRYCVNINWHEMLQNVRTGMQYQAALSQNLISPKIGAGCVLFEVIIVIGDKKSTASYHSEHPSARYTKITACWDHYCLNKVDQQWLYTPSQWFNCTSCTSRTALAISNFNYWLFVAMLYDVQRNLLNSIISYIRF